MDKNTRIQILERLEKYFLTSKIKLNYCSLFELLIFIMLSAKSSDIQVIKVTKKLFLHVSKPSDILKLGFAKLRNIIRSLGLFNKKSIFIFNTCRILIDLYDEKIPMNMTQLLQLPGVGRKTANLFLNIALEKNFIAVDTHVFRVSNRIGFAIGSSTYQVEKKLFQVVPVKFQSRIHTWFGLHGRYFCKSISPKCSVCIINIWCQYFNKEK
ncbi:endonuclease III domain-containing protein [Buchnera aphidicola]|uniref:Endonuclease III n=1 Tax=Buchnera aphidicola (Cinara laricifoliae) TaxID=2518977 RepID=A0A451DAZ9_9GAMM|nr:endonuclease III [Buchnera aphidicola]VFP83552.1 Endonuclease III [Buchnera aphidicola (Cinara laricifoliae)]